MRNRKSNTSTKPSTSPARRRRAPTKPSSSRSLRLSREAQRQLLVVEALRRQTLRLFYRLHVYHGRSGEPKSFSWQDYRDLIVMTHHQLGTPLVWVWDNLSVHLVQELFDFAEENKEWLRVFQLPSCVPQLNPAEGVWSLLKRSIANFAAPNLDSLTRMIKRRLKKIQYRSHLLDGCLAGTGLTLEPG